MEQAVVTAHMEELYVRVSGMFDAIRMRRAKGTEPVVKSIKVLTNCQTILQDVYDYVSSKEPKHPLLEKVERLKEEIMTYERSTLENALGRVKLE